MALIITAYDLAGGNEASTEEVAPSSWRVTATTTDCPALQYVRVDLEVEDEQGNWTSLTDDNDRAIHITLRGNETKSVNAIGINAANGRAIVRPPVDNPSGTINVDSINS